MVFMPPLEMVPPIVNLNFDTIGLARSAIPIENNKKIDIFFKYFIVIISFFKALIKK